MERRRVLLLCTGNSARSQMAEGLVNRYLCDQWEAHSAGIEPTAEVHPLAVEVMAELGIDISTQYPKSVQEFRGMDFDAVITVCDHAAANCPVWLGLGRQAHMGFPDPAAAMGSRNQRAAIFREVRDGLRQSVLSYLAQMDEGVHTHPALPRPWSGES